MAKRIPPAPDPKGLRNVAELKRDAVLRGLLQRSEQSFSDRPTPIAAAPASSYLSLTPTSVLSLPHPHKKERAHGPITPHRPHHRRRRSRHRRGFSQCADHRAGEPAAADAAGAGRHRSRSAQHSDRNAESRHLRAAADRPRHRGDPEISVLGLAHAARARRLDPSGHRARARHLQGDRRRRHAAQHLRPRPHHRGRRGRPPVRRRCRRRRPLVLPQGHPPLDPGARARRL
jgi:hypothetical protein